MAKRNRPNANPAPRDPALFELMHQNLEQLRTANDLQQQIVGNTEHSLLVLDKIHDALSSMASGTSPGGALPFFPGAGGMGFGGGGFSFGPNGGRPILNPNQGSRPTAGPTGYPGGAGYGAGQSFGSYGSMGGFQAGAMGGVLGLAQLAAARYVHNKHGAGQGGAVQYQLQPNGTYTAFNSLGVAVQTGLSQQAAHQRAMVSQAAGRLGSSGSVLGAIKSIPLVGKIAGGALAIAETAQKFGNFVGDQRAANAQYQAIYGPGSDGFDQRMHNFGGRFRNTMSNLGSAFGLSDGGLSDADYDRAFKGISAMGYQGSDRNNMLSWSTGNFKSLGMSVDESLQLIGINAKEAATNFSTLGDQLKNVSTMAQQAGQSAEVFRQSFIQSYGTAVGAGFGGSSGAIATAQVASTAGQGRMFTGLNTSAMYGSVGAQQILAAREGYGSVLDFDLAGQANPMVIANAQQKSLNQVFQAVVPADIRSLVQKEIQRNGGAQNVANDQNRALAVVQAVEQARPGSLNSIAIIQAMQTAGIAGAENLDPPSAAVYYVQWVAKQGRNFTDPVARAMAANDQHVIGNQRTAKGFNANGSDGSTNSVIYGRGGDNSTRDALIAKNGGYGRDAYSTNARGQLVVDPVIGKLERDKVGFVQVETAQGAQIVSTATAAKLYRDQLVKGTAIIESGPNAGQTVGSSYLIEQGAKYKDTTKTKAQDTTFDAATWKAVKGLHLTDTQLSELAALSASGNPLSDDKHVQQIAKYMADQNATSAGGTITVGMKPEVAKYLNITVTGNNLVNRAAAAGGPPSINSTGSSTGG